MTSLLNTATRAFESNLDADPVMTFGAIILSVLVAGYFLVR